MRRASTIAAVLALASGARAVHAQARTPRWDMLLAGSVGAAPDRTWTPPSDQYLVTFGATAGARYRIAGHAALEALVGLHGERDGDVLVEPVRRAMTVRRYAGGAARTGGFASMQVRAALEARPSPHGPRLRATTGVGYLGGIATPLLSLGAGLSTGGRTTRLLLDVDHWLMRLPAEEQRYEADPNVPRRAVLAATRPYHVGKHATLLRVGIDVPLVSP